MKDYSFIEVKDGDGDAVGIYCYLHKEMTLPVAEAHLKKAFNDLDDDDDPDDYLEKQGISRIFCDEVNTAESEGSVERQNRDRYRFNHS